MNTVNTAFGRCTRCQTLPSKIEGGGKLYLWFPVKHILSKVVSILVQAQLGYQVLEDERCLKVALSQDDLEGFGSLLVARLTEKELKETKALWMPGETEPQFYDFSRVISLHNFIHLNKSEWLIDLLASERLTSYFQPIVYAHDPSQIFAQEALLRGFDEHNRLIFPSKIFTQAANAGLLFQLDVLARSSAIRQASRHRIKEHLFINFSPSAVYDPTTCLRMTVQAVDEAGIPHNNVVFEVTESEQPPDIRHLISILRFYQDAGFLVALDDFGTGYSNLDLIHQLRPDFIKLDMQLIRNVHQDPYKALITEKLLEITDQLGIRTVAEGVESVEEFDWVRERGATFVQGYLIAKPTTPPLKMTGYCELESMSVSA